jgi:hypothetical protein
MLTSSVASTGSGADCDDVRSVAQPRSKGDAGMANAPRSQHGGEDTRRQGSSQHSGNQGKESGQGSRGENRKPSSGRTDQSDSGKRRDRASEKEE